MKFALGLFALLAISAAVPHVSHAALAAEEEYRLDNGMKVVLIQKPGSEMTFFQVLVKAGSGNEKTPAEFGLAHLMEHMAFKGSSERPVAVLSPLMEHNGGSSNAYTGQDETGYFVNFPPEKSALALDILSDMIFNPAYDPKEYEAEKEVIVEEIRVSEDTPARRLGSDFSRLFYPPEHPYGHPTLGSADSVRGAGRDAALAFKDTYYRPDNMVLMVIGAFDGAAVRKDIETYFGHIAAPSSPLPAPLQEVPKTRTGPEVQVVVNERIALPKIMIGFDGASATSPLAPPLELAAAVLGSGKSSRLSEKLVDTQKLASSVSCSSNTPKLQGIFSVTLEAEPEKILPAVRAVLDEISRLASTPPGPDELRLTKNQIHRRFNSSQESMYFGYGMQVASFETRFGDWRLMDAWLPRIDKVFDAEISAALAKIARPESLRIMVMLPAKTSPVLSEQELLETAQAFKPASQKDAPGALGAVAATLDCGAELFVIKRPGSQIMHIRAGVPGGRSAEPLDKPGLANFAARVWPAATKASKDVDRAAGMLGGQIEGFSDLNAIGLSASFLAKNQQESLALFVDTLTSPSFNEEDIARVRTEILAGLKRQTEMLSSYTRNLLHHVVYEGSSYGHNPLGDIDTVSKLTPKDLKDFYSDQVRPQRLVIVVTGDVNAEEIKSSFNRMLKKTADRKQLKYTAMAVSPKPGQAPVDYREPLDRSQTNMAMGFITPGLDSPEQAALDVLSTHFNGLAGPLFREMRDERSLAYRVSSEYAAYPGTGLFSFRIGTDPQKAQEALACFEDIIQRTKTMLLTAEELEGAKTFLISRLKTRRQSASGLAGQLFEYRVCGQDADTYEKYLQAIQKVSAQDVQRAAMYLYMQGRVLVSVGKE